MAPDEIRVLINRYIVAYNAFDVDGMLAVLHPEVEFRNLSGGETTASADGAEQFRHLAEQSKGLFSSRRQEVTSLRVDGDTATADIRFEGVLAADLPNGSRAGEVLRLDGRSEFGVRDHRISRIVDHS